MVASELDLDHYGLEYLLGFELAHDRFGLGVVSSIDDETDTCVVKFSQSEVTVCDAIKFVSLQAPWRIDVVDMLTRLVAHVLQMQALTLELDRLKTIQRELQSELRWSRWTSVMNGDSSNGIAVKPETIKNVH
jgi:hypothetical protein